MRRSARDWEAFVSLELRRYLADFQALEIVAGVETVRVHPPYMMQTTTLIDDPEALAKLGQRHRERLRRVQAARSGAPDAVKALLHRHFDSDGEWEQPVACGRAPLADIHSLLQEAIDLDLVPATSGSLHPDSAALRQWLKTYGIGVDCSAFVQHALTTVVRRCYAAAHKTSDEGRCYDVGRMLSRGVYREIDAAAGEDSRFARVATPGEARPGDVLVKKGHIRIVAELELAQDGGVILHLAESTSAKGVPVGATDVDTDIGPRLMRVKYPDPERSIDSQVPLRQRWQDGTFAPDKREHVYILGRLKALAGFW